METERHRTLDGLRVEPGSKAHLGHIFPEPKSPTGQVYSVNSAAFHFIPIEQMIDGTYWSKL